MAFLILIEGVLGKAGRGDVVAACHKVLVSQAAAPDILLRFWSRDVLFSREARRGWIEPDIAALDLTPR